MYSPADIDKEEVRSAGRVPLLKARIVGKRVEGEQVGR